MSGERVEAELTVPNSVDASMTVNIGAAFAASVVTATPGATFPTALLADIQTQLNLNVQGYPQTAAAMQAALGLGDWTNGQGWLLNEASGNLVPAFGATTLTATSLTYGTPGPRGGIDKAIGYDAATDNADGGNIFDVIATDDLIVAWVGYEGSVPGASFGILTKFSSTGWVVQYGSGGFINFQAVKAGPTTDFTASIAIGQGSWYVGIAVVDRSTGKARVGVRTLSGNTTISAEQTATASSYTTAGAFRLGQRADAGIGPFTDSKLAAVYVVDGTGVATGLSANLSTALTNFANSINAAWAVSLSPTTGLVTFSNSFWPSAVFFPPTLRDTVGFAYDFNYPQTAAQMATALGYGAWTSGAGYMCNESAGDLASVFGTPATLTATSLVYSIQGARGGNDRAIGFDAAGDNANGGNSFDVTGPDDLILAWTGYLTANPTASSTAISKVAAAFASGWALAGSGGTGLTLYAGAGGGNLSGAVATAAHINQWHAGLAVIDRSTGKMRIALQNLSTGTQTVGAEGTASGSFTTAASFTLGSSAWTSQAMTEMRFSAVYAVSGSGVATGLSANLSTALSGFATYMRSQTDTLAPSGAWFPGCNIAMDSDPKQAPAGDDGAWSMSPTGRGYKLMSSEYRRHRRVHFPYVTVDRVWANNATIAGADWETFYLETQNGHHSWFEVGARVKVYWDNAGVVTQLGSGAVGGWTMPQCTKLDDLRLPVEMFTGYVEIMLGDLYGEV